MANENPFRPPDQADAPPTAPNDEVMASLRAMRWPQLVLGGLALMGALVMIAFGVLAGVGSFAGSGPERFMMLGVGALYIVFGLFYGVPAGLLVRSGIALALSGSDDAQVAVSARMQLWFWRVLLLQVALLMALYLVLIVGVVVASLGRL